MGDVQLGVIPGVISTKAGWIGGTEVVEVEFDPKAVSYKALLDKAKACNCAAKVFTRSDAQHAVAQSHVGARAERSDVPVRIEDDKYYASRTALRALPMTALQAARANAALRSKQDPEALLAPSQRALLRKIEVAPKAWPSAIGVPFVNAWTSAQAFLAKQAKPTAAK